VKAVEASRTSPRSDDDVAELHCIMRAPRTTTPRNDWITRNTYSFKEIKDYREEIMKAK
jgi:hypothetical protein